MKQQPITAEDSATERSLVAILGAFAIGFTGGVVITAALVALTN